MLSYGKQRFKQVNVVLLKVSEVLLERCDEQ